MWFNSYRLSRPPLVNDPYDPESNAVLPSLRSRSADALVLLSAVVGVLVALTALERDAPGERVALGSGVVLAGFGLAQLVIFFPEARAAWASGRRRGVGILALVTAIGAALVGWGLTG
jgi:hypothetical protein